VGIIKELIYTSGRTLIDVYRQGTTGSFMDIGSFMNLVKSLSNNHVSESDIQKVFEHVSDKQALTFENFEKAFKIAVPTPGSLLSETTVIKQLREWMFTRQYPAQSAFDRLVRSCDRLSQKSLRRSDMHKAMLIN